MQLRHQKRCFRAAGRWEIESPQALASKCGGERLTGPECDDKTKEYEGRLSSNDVEPLASNLSRCQSSS